jgi:LCP family protein required for cell wall assembly
MEDPASAPAGDGPAGHRVRKARFRRVALLVAGTLAIVVVLAGVGGALLLRRYNDAFNKDTLLAPGSRAGGPHASVKGPLNLLLIGSDERTGNPDAGQRSDTIIIAHIPSSMDHVYLISVPRDLRVKIPPDPSMNFSGDTTKINAAFEYGHGGVGGAQLVSATLTDLVGVQFDGAAVINFGGLKEAVDVLGGVEMCVDTQVVSIHTNKVFQPGCRLMNSTDVLDYLRQRNFPDGDYSRQRHQQQFLKAFLRRAVATGAGSNPVKLDSLLRSVASTMTVDTGEMALPDLVFALRDLRPDNITGIKIPSGVDTIDQTSYVVTDPDADGLFDAIRTDSMARWAKDNQAWVNKI